MVVSLSNHYASSPCAYLNMSALLNLEPASSGGIELDSVRWTVCLLLFLSSLILPSPWVLGATSDSPWVQLQSLPRSPCEERVLLHASCWAGVGLWGFAAVSLSRPSLVFLNYLLLLVCFLCILQSPTVILILHLWVEIKAQRNKTCSYCENRHLACCLIAPPSVFSSFLPPPSPPTYWLPSPSSIFFPPPFFFLFSPNSLASFHYLSLLCSPCCWLLSRPSHMCPGLFQGSLAHLAFALPWSVSGSFHWVLIQMSAPSWVAQWNEMPIPSAFSLHSSFLTFCICELARSPLPSI